MTFSDGIAPKHYFLQHVPDSKRELAESCGLVRFKAEGHADLWMEPFVFQAPLKDAPNESLEGWLIRNGIAYQIYVAGMWGAGPE